MDAAAQPLGRGTGKPSAPSGRGGVGGGFRRRRRSTDCCAGCGWERPRGLLLLTRRRLRVCGRDYNGRSRGEILLSPSLHSPRASRTHAWSLGAESVEAAQQVMAGGTVE